MTAAINVSSTADRLLFTDLDPAWMGFHELTPQQEDDDDRKQQVDDGEGGKWYDQSGHRSHRIAGAHEPIDDPGLSSEFGHKPAGLYGNEAKRRTTDQRTQQPFVICNRRVRHQIQATQAATASMADPVPTMMSKDQCTNRTFDH